MIEKGDFVKLHYTGKLQDGRVFDTTDEAVAKANGLAGTRATFAPVIVVVGERMLVPGLDDALQGKEPGAFTVHLTPDKAFGKKDPKDLRIIPQQQLRQQGIQPHPGMELNIDGQYGVVRSAGSGRVVVDFNHPLASQDITYDVQVLGVVTDPTEKVVAALDAAGVPHTGIVATASSCTIGLASLPPQPVLDAIHERVARLTGIGTVAFEQGAKPTKKGEDQ